MPTAYWSSNYVKTALNTGTVTSFGNASGSVDYSDTVSKSHAETAHFEELCSQGSMLPILAYTLEKGVDRYFYNLHYRTLNVYDNQAYNTRWDVHRYFTKSVTAADLRETYRDLIESTRNKCRVKLHKKISDVKVQSAVELGELKETRKMLMEAFADMANFARAFRHGHIKDIVQDMKSLASHATRSELNSRYSADSLTNLRKRGRLRATINRANNRYLEATYGIEPFVSSLSDITGQIVRQLNDLDSPRKFVRVSSSAVAPHSSQLIDEISGPYSSNPVRRLERNTFEYRVWMGGMLNDWDTSRWHQWGISPGEILPTIWELTTLSFLADYVTNFGDWLRNADLSYKLLNSNYTWISERMRSVVSLTGIQPKPIYSTLNPSVIVEDHAVEGFPSEYIWFQRRPMLIGDTVISFQFETPSFRQSMNAASLALARVL